MNILVGSLPEIEKVVDHLMDQIDKGYRVFLLEGELGAGKTTLVQALCKRLGIDEAVTSPTFSLINAYTTESVGVVYHMDLYRIEKQGDLVQLGLEEYLESGQVCMIEWPEIAAEYIYPPYSKIVIEADTNNIRNFIITTYDTVDA